MSWLRVKLGDVAIINPRPPRDVDESQQVTFVAMASASEEGYLLASEARIFSETKKGFTYFDKNDVLLAKITPCFENGKCLRPGQIPTEIGFGSTEFHVIRPVSEKLDGLYLFYVLWNEQFRFLGQKSMSGAAGQKRVGSDFLKGFEIPLPPLPEQKRIAAILDKADAIRRKRQQAIQLADDFLRAVFLDMFGDPVTNPKGFPVGTIRDLVDTANYGSSAKASETEGEFPILRMGNITYSGAIEFSDLKYIDISKKDQPKYLVEKGDLLFNRTNSKELVGKAAVYDRDDVAAIAGYLVRVRMNEKGNSYYVSGYLNSMHGKSTLQSMCKSIVGMANINAQEMQDIKILLPPIEMQNKYAAIFKATNQRLKSNGQSEGSLTVLFFSLSQKAFRGEL